jgi:cellulose synthase/poly-beta-1,6-N-acetylglucosamine synthase-like glycosyltransferase
MIVYNSLQYILIILLGMATMYILFFAIAGLFYRQKKYIVPEKIGRTAVLIPCYREDTVIIEVALAALQQNYPRAFFDVVVIADSFKKDTIVKLKALPIMLIEVSFDKSTKSKALNKAMEMLTLPYDIAVVLDADNIMATDFLQKINAVFEQGAIAVQGHRAAKNLNNSWAILDAVSEEINNHIFRKGHRAAGLSSAIIGSGMAFSYDYFKTLMASAKAVGGFDKEIELKMLKQGVKIMYLDDAYVYDEKVQESEVFSNQRRRWLSAQLHYFRKGFPDAVKELFRKGNIDYFDKAIQFIQPPRVLLLAAVMISGTTFIILNALLNVALSPVVWIILMIACITTLLISVPRSLLTLKTFSAAAGLPKGMLLMMLSLLKTKGANKTFIHTKHTSGSR